MVKDLFSEQSKIYAQFRPTYPQELFEYLLQFVQERKCTWDCATGNGQAATVLANYFEKVEATDISPAQISNAPQKQNINYHVCPAEETHFANNSFDLITVAQAYHWLNWRKFHDEVNRVGKPNAIIAIWAYNLLVCGDEEVNNIIKHFYRDVIGPYWDYERKYVDEGYVTVDFNFQHLPPKIFQASFTWSREQLKGYFLSWSAVRKYIKEQGENPVELIEKEIDAVWNEKEHKEIRFPIFLRIGKIAK